MVAVTQYATPDPALSGLPNYSQFIQYNINGLNYILDPVANILYFDVAGTLQPTNSSVAQFQAFLAANTLTTGVVNPAGPTPAGAVQLPGTSTTGFASTVTQQPLTTDAQKILAYMRVMHRALVALATGGGVDDRDFDPGIDIDFGSPPAPPRPETVFA